MRTFNVKHITRDKTILKSLPLQRHMVEVGELLQCFGCKFEAVQYFGTTVRVNIKCFDAVVATALCKEEALSKTLQETMIQALVRIEDGSFKNAARINDSWL